MSHNWKDTGRRMAFTKLAHKTPASVRRHRIFVCTICGSEVALPHIPSPDEKIYQPAAPFDFDSDPVRELTCEEVILVDVMES